MSQTPEVYLQRIAILLATILALAVGGLFALIGAVVAGIGAWVLLRR